MKSKIFLLMIFLGTLIFFNSYSSQQQEDNNHYAVLQGKIKDQLDLLKDLYNETSSSSGAKKTGEKEKLLIDYLYQLNKFLYSEDVSKVYTLEYFNKVKNHNIFIRELIFLFEKNNNKVVEVTRVNKYLDAQKKRLAFEAERFNKKFHNNQQDISSKTSSENEVMSIQNKNTPPPKISIEINNNNNNVEENNNAPSLDIDPKTIKQKRFNDFIKCYDSILEGNPEDIKKRQEKLKQPNFNFTKEEERQEAEKHFSYIQTKINITKYTEIEDVVRFYCHKNIDEKHIDNHVSPHIHQFINNPTENTAKEVFELGDDCGFFLMAETFLRYYFNPLSKNADLQKEYFLIAMKNKYHDLAKMGLREAQKKIEDLYVKFSYFINKVEEDCKKAETTEHKSQIVNKNRQEYIVDFTQEKKHIYYENLYESLKGCSVSELKKRLNDIGHTIKEDSYLHYVFSTCSILEDKFKEEESSLDEKLGFYEQVLQSNNNPFLINVQSFIENPSKIALVNLLMLDDMDTQIAYKEIILPTSAIIAVCFRNYCYNPFFKESIQKQKKVFGLVFDDNKYRDFVLSEAFRKDFYSLYDSFNNEHDHKRILYIDGDKNSTNSGTIESNRVSSEVTGEQLFEKFSAHVFNNASASEWKRAALYNLTKFNGSYLSNFLENKDQKSKTFAKLYKYILRPLVSTSLKTGIKDEAFFIKVLNSAVTCASGQELKSLEKLLNKLENTAKFSGNIKEKIAHINHHIENERAQEKDKKVIKSTHNVWEQSVGSIKAQFSQLEEERIDLLGYRSMMDILGSIQYSKVFYEKFLNTHELKNNINDTIFDELDDQSESILKDNDTIKNSHDRASRYNWWKDRIDVWFVDRGFDKIGKMIKKNSLKWASEWYKTYQQSTVPPEQIDMLMQQSKSVQDDMNKSLLQLKYDFFALIHENPNSIPVQKVFKEINEQYTNPPSNIAAKTVLKNLRQAKIQGL